MIRVCSFFSRFSALHSHQHGKRSFIGNWEGGKSNMLRRAFDHWNHPALKHGQKGKVQGLKHGYRHFASCLSEGKKKGNWRSQGIVAYGLVRNISIITVGARSGRLSGRHVFCSSESNVINHHFSFLILMHIFMSLFDSFVYRDAPAK